MMPAHSIFKILLIIWVSKSALTISLQELRIKQEDPYDYTDTVLSPVDVPKEELLEDNAYLYFPQQLLNEFRRIRRYPIIKRNDLLCRMSVGGAGAGACDTKNHQNIGYLKSASSPGRRKRRDLRLFRI